MKKPVVWLVVAGVSVVTAAAIVTRGIGFSARATPWTTEETVLRAARRWATPGAVRRQANPVSATSEAIEGGLKHWADRCASCHGNDGSGDKVVAFADAHIQKGERIAVTVNHDESMSDAVVIRLAAPAGQ